MVSVIKDNKTSEKYIERALVKQVEALGGLCIKLLTNHFLGLPDRMVLLPGGKMLFVELKSTGQKPRKIQTVVHSKLRVLGFTVLVIDNVEQVMELIKEAYGQE